MEINNILDGQINRLYFLIPKLYTTVQKATTFFFVQNTV